MGFACIDMCFCIDAHFKKQASRFLKLLLKRPYMPDGKSDINDVDDLQEVDDAFEIEKEIFQSGP